MSITVLFWIGAIAAFLVCLGFAAWNLSQSPIHDPRPAPAYRIEDAPMAMLMVDRSGRITAANTLLEQLFGYDAGELNHQPLETLIPFASRKRHQQLWRDYFANPLPRPMSQRDLSGLHKSGRLIPIEVGLSAAVVRGRVTAFATVLDITEKKRSAQELVNANALMAAIIESAPFSIISTDVDGLISAASPATESMLGYQRDELIGKHSPALFHDPREIEARAAELTQELQQEIEPGFEVFAAKPRRGDPESHPWTYIRKDGSRLLVQLTVTAMYDDSRKIIGFLGMAYDITEKKRSDDNMRYLAHHDVLTGLPNRTLLHDRLTIALDRARRFQHRVGLMLIDLDHFKQINDSLGHSAGDRLLTAIGERLLACVRNIDTVARLGGDEFVVVLSDIDDADQAMSVANKIAGEISRPVSYSNHVLQVTPSVGVCLFPDHGNDIPSLLKHADLAMYAAKARGRDAAELFSLAAEMPMAGERRS